MRKIKEIKGNIQNIQTSALVRECEIKQTRHNSNYLHLNLEDQTGSIRAMMWDYDKNEKAHFIKAGQVIDILQGDASEKNGITSLIIKDFDVKEDVDIDKYIKSAPLSKEELQNGLFTYVQKIENEMLYHLVFNLIKNKKDIFFTQPAATNIHHEFKGGLAYHTITMLDISERLCDVYPSLKKDLMIAGIVAHDLGKTEEIIDYIDPNKTFEGELLGHINIVNDLITKEIYDQDLSDGDYKLLIELKHIVLSHHGELEYGSNITPRTKEAQIIHYIDQIDAKMMMFDKAFDEVESGEFTRPIYPLHNNKLYKR